MKEQNRLKNSIFNLVSGFAYKILVMFTAFVVRSVFIYCLNEDYLGINGLYTDILSMLSLAELGFGTAMVYSMYKPLAEKDYNKLAQLLALYKKVYTIVGGVILILGLAITPFLDYLIKNKPDVEGLTFYYLLFLGNTVLSYWFFAYRNSILQADQKAYIISNYQSVFGLLKSFLQIVILLIFRNYTLYLLIQIGCTIAQNIAIAYKVKKMYPVFARREVEELPAIEKKRIFKDVQALMLSKVCHVVLESSDTIIISAFVGVNWIGYLSNFTMIINAIVGILAQITSAISASLGNFFAQEDREEGYRLFQRVEFLNYWLYGFSMIALIVLMNPFVELWIGKKFVLSQSIVIALAIRFFIAGFMNTLWTFRSTLGLFTQGQWRQILVAALNIALSIALSYKWGVVGVVAATSISRACVSLWYDPWLIHSKGFKKPVLPFFVKYIFKVCLLGAITIGMTAISGLILAGEVTVMKFIVLVLLTAIIPNAIFLIIFGRSDEFQYYLRIFDRLILSKIKRSIEK